MDLVDYSEDVFSRLQGEFLELARHLSISSVQCIPISALEGDNLVAPSDKTPWYSGPTLLQHLETVRIQPEVKMDALRFPVQSVIRPDANFRGFAGRLASGAVQPGDTVVALPSGQRTRVESIVSFDGELEAAYSSQSVVLKLADEIDLSRGDMLVSTEEQPCDSTSFAAMVVWLHATPLELNRVYLAKHAGKQVKARATQIRYRVDVNSLEEHSANHLEMNEIALVEFETSQPIFFDPYARNRTTGSLILIDPQTNATVGAVMIREELRVARDQRGQGAGIRPAGRIGPVTLDERIQRRGHLPAIFTVEGDRTRAEELERTLIGRGFETGLVSFREIPPASRRAVLSTLWSLGLVIISWQKNAIRHSDLALLESIAGKFHLALAGEEAESCGRDGLRRAVQIAETLRITREPNKGKEDRNASTGRL
jgi:hypothetical protein